MTFDEMLDELTTVRFGEGKRPLCKNWLNARMAMVWGAGEWPFKKAIRELRSVDANGVVSMPNTFRRMLSMETTSDSLISYVSPHEFKLNYPATNTESASFPDIFTVENGIAYVRPKGVSSVYISYERKLCHKDVNSTVIVGGMAADNDKPVWDEEFHYVLVSGAFATGMKAMNDPTWDALEGDYHQMLAAMKEEYLPPDLVVNRQYGRIAD